MTRGVVIFFPLTPRQLRWELKWRGRSPQRRAQPDAARRRRPPPKSHRHFSLAALQYAAAFPASWSIMKRLSCSTVNRMSSPNTQLNFPQKHHTNKYIKQSHHRQPDRPAPRASQLSPVPFSPKYGLRTRCRQRATWATVRRWRKVGFVCWSSRRTSLSMTLCLSSVPRVSRIPCGMD